MMWRPALVVLIAAPLAACTGSAGCPCLTSFAGYGMADNSPLTATISDVSYTYPANYGLSTCTAHDATLTPFCDVAASDRPGWCDDAWCYVDPSRCNLVTSQSAYFTDLVYSYGTCGQTNTFELWFGSGGTSHVLSELVTLASGYLKSIVEALESTEAELRQADLSAGACKYQPSCRCCGCEENEAWSAPGTPNFITLSHTTTTPNPDPAQPAPNIDTCLAETLGVSFQRIAAKESDGSRVGYEYYGSQLGTYMQWPGMDWCPRGDTAYDPRFRPWFAAGAAGPKDVVIVIDTSGSMRGNRIEMAEKAAKKVIDTLTESDYASVVAFDSSASADSATLVRMTTAAKADAKRWIASNVGAGGGTNFRAALEKVWQLLQSSSSSTSYCNRVVLFLSDGVPSAWESADYTYTASMATLHNVHLLTYGLGSGADATILKRLACENEGIYFSVSDNDNLGDVMASYYTILSPMIEPCQVRFTEYEDWFTKKRLLGACLAAYKKADTTTPSACAVAAPNSSNSIVTEPPHLIGVACIDMSLIASNASLRANAGWADFEAAVRSAMQACPRRTLSAGAMEQLRAAVGPDAVCTSSSLSTLSTSPTYLSRTGELEACASGYPDPNDPIGPSGPESESSSIGVVVVAAAAGAVLVVSAAVFFYRVGQAQGKRASQHAPRGSEMTASRQPAAPPVVAGVALPMSGGVPMGQPLYPTV